MQRMVVALVLSLAATASLAVLARAQEGEPSAGAECTVEPYDLTTVLTPIAATPSDELTPTESVERPRGEPADDEIVAAVTETIELFIGCYNQGYQYRSLYLFTPEYLLTFLGDEQGLVTEQTIAEVNEAAMSEVAAEPLPEDQQTVIHAIEDVEVLDDGRVIATVVGDNLADPEEGPNPVYLIFREVDGRYLIDEVIDPQPDEPAED